MKYDVQKVKEMLSKEVLGQLQPIESIIIRSIIFDSNNEIDWDKVYDLINENQPELKTYECYSEENMKTKEEPPYITNYLKFKTYNPNYGDRKKCSCGHEYLSHFDPYEDMDACGCKYCGCNHFVLNVEEDNE